MSSVLPLSTTTISSAHDALSMAAPIWAASFLVMMVTVTRGTGESYKASGSGLRAFEATGRDVGEAVRPRPQPVAALARRRW